MVSNKKGSEERRQLIESTLDAAITTIDFVTQVVPLDVAQNALSSIKTLLTIIRDTMKNKQDFADLAEESREIALVLWHASSNVTDGELSRPLISAIEGVQVVVDRICYEIEEKARRNVAVKLFSVSADKVDIEGWRGDLEKCLQVFNTKLNVLANVNVINMSEMLDEMRSTQLAGSPSATPVRQPPPPRPTMFFGRDALVQQAVQLLLKPQHFAFLGPGGMGKSSLAKAVLSDAAVISEFRDERYFVAFDDLDTPGGASSVSFGTFFNRLANALGLRPAKADAQKLVLWQLHARRALIVLDNAETFLHGGQDAARIATALDEIGAIPSVVLLFTTRSAALPPNLLCETLRIPALDLAAAREAFSAIYSESADIARIGPLLSELGCHPLSITLLAQTARQNHWTVTDIEDAWREQKTRILHTQTGPDAGKNQSLAVSIDLTLNSRALKDVQPEALQLLQIIAFFPKGLNRRKLKELFPSLPDAQNVVNLLCKLSLAYVHGDVVTILAPIRTHILSTHGESPAKMPLFADLRTFYRSSLKEHGMSDSATRESIAPWFSGEADNVAYMLMYDLDAVTAQADVDMTKLEECYSDCYFFLKHITLSAQRFRPLEDKILRLPDYKPRRMLGVSAGLASRTNRVIDWKADCLVALANLAAIDVDAKALELFDAALALKRTLGSDKDVAYVLSCKGGLLMDMERFGDARATLESALATKEPAVQATAHVRLAMITAYTGGGADAEQAIAGARAKYGAVLRETGALPGAILCQARIAALAGHDEAVRKFLRECVDASKTFGASRTRAEALLLLADIAIRQGDAEEALQYVGEAQDASSQRKDHVYSECLASRASIAMDAGDYETARVQLLHAFTESYAHYGRGTWAEAYTQYRCGRLELLAGNFPTARKMFRTCLELANALSDIGLRARTRRAFGELDLLEGEVAHASTSFRGAKACCEEMGLEPRYLYNPSPQNFRLPDRYGGWSAFLEGRS